MVMRQKVAEHKCLPKFLEAVVLGILLLEEGECFELRPSGCGASSEIGKADNEGLKAQHNEQA
jgi:hypothetical protein